MEAAVSVQFSPRALVMSKELRHSKPTADTAPSESHCTSERNKSAGICEIHIAWGVLQQVAY